MLYIHHFMYLQIYPQKPPNCSDFVQAYMHRNAQSSCWIFLQKGFNDK